ncbi:MAG: glucosaminidase domain-containing protein [Candidatus Woesearchaeota archaeon]|jgi:uncharacterized FlgJ-related protein|nr:glucosaminidase domain-containing protein [Candidatus Woesearchaeota archaeon]
MKNFLVFLLFIVISISISFKEPPKMKLPEVKKDKIITKQEILSSIWKEIIYLKLEHPEIVYSQILLETGYLSSELFKTNNNLFGMRISGSRATTSNKIINGYKWYPHWKDSLLDYALLQMAFYKGKSKKEYHEKLKRVYAEDPFYIIKLQKIQETLGDPST